MIPLKIADMAVAACNEEIAKLQAENARLKAEVERLTKAGDAMAKLLFIEPRYIGSSKQEAVIEWCKATETKEGKQS